MLISALAWEQSEKLEQQGKFEKLDLPKDAEQYVQEIVSKPIESRPPPYTHTSFCERFENQCSKLPTINTAISSAEDVPGPSGPLPDAGSAAYRILLAAVMVESMVIGVPLTFGLFQDYYKTNTTLSSQGESSWIGVLSIGLQFLGAPLVTYLVQRRSLNEKSCIWGGWIVCVLSLLGASFCRTLPPLILTQGLLYGIGALLVDIALLCILNTWFVRRRGMAYGIVFGTADLMGVAGSFLANYLLHRHGLKITLLTFSAIVFSFPGPAIFYLRKRNTIDDYTDTPSQRPKLILSPVAFPTSSAAEWSHPTRRYYQHSIFYILVAGNLLQSLAFYLPFIYLPSFTTDLGQSSSKGAIVLAVANIAQIVGEIGFGKLSDKVNVNTLVFTSSTIASLTTFTLWGLATSFTHVVAYALLFGISASGFIILWARMGTLFGERDAQMVYSIMSFGRGVGSIASGPISAALLNHTKPHYASMNGRYSAVMMFVGVCMAGSALCGGAGAIVLWWKKRPAQEQYNLREDESERERRRVGVGRDGFHSDAFQHKYRIRGNANRES